MGRQAIEGAGRARERESLQAGSICLGLRFTPPLARFGGEAKVRNK